MSTQYAPGQEDDATESTDSPGRRLRVARQAQGLELDRVAADLHLSKSMIESLEHDDYDALPGQVFIVGYIRKYARVVGLDPEPLLAAYQRTVPRNTRTWLRPRTAPKNARQGGSGRPIVRLASAGVAILLAGLAVVWWTSQPPGEEPETVEAGTMEQEAPEATAMPEPPPEQRTPPPIAGVAVPPPDALQPAPRPPQPLEPVPETPALAEPGQQPPAVEPAAEATPAASEDDGAPDAAAEAESAAASEDAGEGEATESGEILVTFDGPCWVDVRDSERKFKLFGEMKKGDSHVLKGTPPYSVILGNAAAVRITVGGEPFDLSTVSQGNVARFTLDPSESP